MSKSVRAFGGTYQWRDWEKYEARVKAKAIKAQEKRRERYERGQEALRKALALRVVDLTRKPEQT